MIREPSNPITMIDYKFDSYEAVPAELAYKSEPIGNMSAGVDRTAVKGLKTYEKIRVLTEQDRTAGYIERAYYYDMLGRVLQVVEKNYLGGISYFTTAYDLQGNLTFRRERVVPKTGCAEDLLTVEYTYDNAGRMLTQTSTFNTSKPVTVTYSYNEIGQLVRKNINGLIEDYTYNVQGWLTSQDSPYYSARLKYYDSENPSYTGNITEWNWGGAGTMPHTYKYEYDALSRLTEARYSGNMGTDRYSERGIKYDRNGNILKMTRGLNEQLEYKYNDAGQLYGINQASVVYDNLGNLVRDSRNGLTIAYNFLNLPMQIKSSADNFELNYCYRADTTNRKALDYLLCGVLLDKDLKGFYNLFQQYFPQGEAIPIHYQEALLVVDLMFPHLDATRNYPVTPTCRLAFEDFGVLMSQRPNTDHVLRQKYGNTYWYYGFIRTA